ncbi:M1 family aminopeptidase [Kribbella sp. NPDC020789]
MWSSGASNILTVVHENAHQWFGNSVSLNQWRDIWLSESFARYAEWLWDEDHGGKSAQAVFDELYAGHPADDPWWTFLVGEPGAGHIFEDPLYGRGAMALQALRNRVGEPVFRQILIEWTTAHRFGTVTIEGFVDHASTVAGDNLSEFFGTWLFTGSKPEPGVVNGTEPRARRRSQ